MRLFKTVFLWLVSLSSLQGQISVKASVDHVIPNSTDNTGNINLSVSGGLAPYTYLWNPGGMSTQNISNKTKNRYSVKVTDSNADTAIYSYSLGYKVQWDNLKGNGYFRNDTLAGGIHAISKNTLLPNEDGWVEYVHTDFSGGNIYIGFLDSISPVYDISDIDYGIISYYGLNLYYFESGSAAVMNSPMPGDVIRIERIGDTINYRLNGVIQRSVTAPGISQKTFKLTCNVDPSIVLTNVGCSFIHSNNVTFKNYVKTQPVIKHSSSLGTNDGKIILVPGQPGPQTYSWSPGGATTSSITALGFGTYSVTVADSASNKSPYQYNIGYKVQWNDLAGNGYFRNDTLAGGIHATSKNTLLPNENGWVEYVHTDFSGGNIYIGFTDSLSLAYDVSDINYGIISYYGLNLYYFESGSAAVMNSPMPGDVIRIERIGDTINYRLNGVIQRSVTAPGISRKTFKLTCNVDPSIVLTNVGCSFMHTDSISFDNYVRTHAVIKHSSGPGITDGRINIIPDYLGSHTYNWSPGGATTSSLTSLGLGTYSVTVSDSLANQSSYTYNMGYKVQWKILLAEGGYYRNDSISGVIATCKNTLLPGESGWVEFAQSSDPGAYYIGFTDSLSPVYNDEADIDYGIFSYNGYLHYEESGSSAVIGYPVPNDIIRIERVGDTINYRINGAIVRSIHTAGILQKTLKLKGDISGLLANVGCSFMHTDSITFKNYVKAHAVIKHSSEYGANDGAITVIPYALGTYTYTWSGGADTTSINKLDFGSYGITVADSMGNRSPYSYNVGYKVKWGNLSGGYFRNDTLGDDTYAQSKNVLMPNTDGWMEYVENNPSGNYFIGFADSITPGYDLSDMDYGFYSYSGLYLYYYENGILSILGSPGIGDIIRLERIGDTINYKINGALVRSVSAPGLSAKKFKLLGLVSSNVAMANIGCSFSNSGTPLAVKFAKAHASVDKPNSGIIALSGNGGVPPYSYNWAVTGATGNLQTNLAPGDYTITVKDAVNDTLTVTASIGLKNNWRAPKNITTVNDLYTSTSTSTTSAGALVSYNIVPDSTDGFCELTVTDSTNNTAFGFLGFNTSAVDTNYTSPFVRQGAVDTLLVFADSLLMNRKIALGSKYMQASAYSKLNLVYFVNDTVKIGFKQYTTPGNNAVTYQQGDVFTIRRTGSGIYLYKNGSLAATGATAGMDTQYLLNGIFITAGSSRILNSASMAVGIKPSLTAGLATYKCAEVALNWVQTRTFDEYGVIKSDSKTFMDQIGRTIQSQSKIISKNNILVTEPLYDGFGRAVGQSLPSPSYGDDLCYVPAFIEHAANIAYSPADFDNAIGTGTVTDIIDAFNAHGDVNNPKPVSNTTQGRLGWYYSNNNTSEPLVAADNLPYARVEFYDDGRTRRSAGVGNTLKMGSGHETKFIYTSTPALSMDPTLNELNYVFPYRTYELERDFSVSAAAPNLNLQLFKTISINPDGKDQITYTSSSGQTIATCITGDGSACVTHTQVTTLYPVTDQEKIQNIYIPKAKSGTLHLYELDAYGTYTTAAVPALKDLMTGNVLTSGTDYTYSATTGYFTFTGSYVAKSLYLQVTYNTLSVLTRTLLTSVEVDYTQWTLYFYDRKDRLLANASPNDVVCQTLPYLLQSRSGLGNPQSCSNDRVTAVKVNSSVQSSSNVTLFIDITQQGGTLNTLTSPVPPSSFVLKSQTQKNYEDSLYIAHDTLVSDTTYVSDPTDTTKRFMNIGMPALETIGFYKALDSLETQLPANALKGKSITYTGEYAVYAKVGRKDTLSNELATIPYNFTVESDGQTDSTGSAIIKVTQHNGYKGPLITPVLTPSDYDSLIIKIKNTTVVLTGFDTGGENFGPCTGQLYVPPNMQPVLHGLNQYTQPLINAWVLSTPDPITIPLANKYMYDEYDRLVESTSDDEGLVDYVYDQLEDKLLFTQNDKQRANGGRFSCIVYDKLGRPVLSGEYKSTTGSPNPYQFQNYYDYKNGVAVTSGHISTGTAAYTNGTGYNDGRITDPTYIVYDSADVTIPGNIGAGISYKQNYTAGKVSKTRNNQSTTWYSYDELGRQKRSLQYSAELGYKTMNYTYDFTGNLKESDYQFGNADNMVHIYTYDADNRLSTVSAGVVDIANPASLKPIANYSYYLHGPLKRTVLGGNLQGLDYIYTIDGKLKSVNNPISIFTADDPGLDGYSTGPNPGVSPDAFSYALEYYKDDYVRSGSPVKSYNYTSAYNDDNTSYTGLVKASSWRTLLPASATANYTNTLMYEYKYDEQYRLTGAQFGTVEETMPVIAGHTLRIDNFTQLPQYKLQNISYDQNGNLQTLKRYAAPTSSTTAHLLDDLTYNYSSAHKNSLQHITDAAVNTASYTAELDLPTQTVTANYVYNQIGELTANTQEDKGFEYNAAGLTTRVYKLSTGNNIAAFTYNDKGLRHSKTSYNGLGTAIKATYYSYDAGGAQVATYVRDLTVATPTTMLQDYTLYGAGRVATHDVSTNTTMYELTDHLGNVRAVIKDDGTSHAQTVSYTDFFPHGSIMPGQSYQSSLNFPYSYQGQEKDAETGLTNFELRQYDARIGRWYNPDPMGQHHSPYLAMGNNPVSSIDPDGGYDSDDGAGLNWASNTMMSSNEWFAMNPYDRNLFFKQHNTSTSFSLYQYTDDGGNQHLANSGQGGADLYNQYNTASGNSASYNSKGKTFDYAEYRHSDLVSNGEHTGDIGDNQTSSLNHSSGWTLGSKGETYIHEYSISEKDMQDMNQSFANRLKNRLPATGAMEMDNTFIGGAVGGVVAKNAIRGLGNLFAKNVSAEGAVWAQTTFGRAFGANGSFAGQTIDDVVSAIRNGVLSPSDVPINAIVRNGQTFILNTRSSVALIRAGIPRSSWRLLNQTGVRAFEDMLTGQLERNGLINGTNTIKEAGTQAVLTH